MFIPKLTLPLAFTAALIAGPVAHGQTVQSRTTTAETLPGSIQAAPAGTTTATTTTTSAGLVSEIAPDGFLIRTETSPTPIRYSFSTSTVYVDEAGAPVSRELVTSGLPVTVQYSREGDRLIANRVVVRRQMSTTTTGAPTVIERNTTVTTPPQIVEKKVYVDRPVIVEKKVPVVMEKKVYVDRPVDRPVIVEKPVIVERPARPAAVIEEKKTTTTTTTSGGKKKDD